MRITFLIATLTGAFVLTPVASAVERIEEPLTFQHALKWRSDEAASFKRLDMNSIEAQDAVSERAGRPPRIAVARKETPGQEFERFGEWSEIDDMSVWRLKIASEGAKWLSASFEQLVLPPGASLYVYNESREQLRGPYTNQDSRASGKFWTPMVSGETAYLEINVPTKFRPQLSFDLTSINHGYRSLKTSAGQKSGACNIDVVCPQGDAWRDQIRSVARYFYERSGDFFVCTGNLLNNTSADRRPYFLTANHCVSTATEVESMIFFWNYETSVCGGFPDGDTSQAQAGATLLATLGSLDGPLPERDMTLVELDATPNSAFNVFYSGWESGPAVPGSGVSIHHPDGSEKRISIESGPITRTGYLTPTQDPSGTHLRIAAWDQGTTEQGSSGAGFWNAGGRLVGVLSGGAAACDNPAGSDYYAFLAAHYNVGAGSSTRLKAWLDPQNTGVSGIDGLDSCVEPQVSIAITPNPAEVNQTVAFTSTVSGVSDPQISYEWDFDGDDVIDSTDANPAFTYTSSYSGDVSLTVTSQTCAATESGNMVVFPEGGNTSPVASAVAAPSQAGENSVVQLNGSGSFDPNGDALTYVWSQVSGPAASVSSSSDVSPTVTLPMVTADTDLTFELIVTDIFGANDTDSTTVTVQNVNQPPVALVSQSAIVVNEGTTVNLNAGASSDPDGDSLTFSWSQTSGTNVTLSNAQSSLATFTAPQVSAATVLSFTVTVTDPDGLFDTAVVSVTVNNIVPPSNDSGGGGAVGWPVFVLMCVVAGLRRNRRLIASATLVSAALMMGGCGTPQADGQDKTSITESQSVEAEPEMSILLTRRDAANSVARITDQGVVRQLTAALEKRERRYEKIKPVFDFEIQIINNGQSEIWQLSRSGYAQEKGTGQLYRMDMSALENYMN